MPCKSDYRVQGLDCAEEVVILRREVGALPGVINLEFDVVNARMSVEYDAEAVPPERIVAAVDATGMKALPWEIRGVAPSGSFWVQHGRLVLAVLGGVLLVAGFVTHWMLHGSLLDAFAGSPAETHTFPLSVILLYGGATVAGAWFVVPRAVSAARRLRPDMNLLMVLAVIGAMAIGEWFEAATVAVLFAVALLLEHWSVERARHAIGALLDLSPRTARIRGSDDGELHELPVGEVPTGARGVVRPGERIPLDGDVTQGGTTVNQAPITGESMPVVKRPGDPVYAGTVNLEGVIEFRSTRPATDTTLARIVHLVARAQSRRARSEQWVDRFAVHYTPLMMFAALAAAVLPPLLCAVPWADGVYRGLVILVIACPCALVISTPVSIVSALTASARAGVLVKGGIILEAAGRLKALALDKTGTLTRGQPDVQRIVPFHGHTAEDVMARAAALESSSEHPLARAIIRQARAAGLRPPAASGFRSMPGKGAEALLDGRMFWIGSHRFMHEKGQETPEVHAQALELEDAGHTVVALGNDTHVCGLISIADSLRDGVPRILDAIRRAGVERVVMLTGDNEGTARAIAAEAGIDEFHCELLPEDKVAVVGRLVREHTHVAMVGDGINDTPAMAAATFGIAMGAMGTDTALETADVALMSDDLSRLPWLIRQSRRTLGIIRQNIAFALGLKIVFIALTMAGRASLWMAIAADTGATLLVVFNSLRLLGATPPPEVPLRGP
ncbi:MAG: heavy metal translocating P-type ATPase [Lentisphaerae bacterium]|nr:heavy metal translocating P-type ATPase [Lentisphaerota bacterium]